MLMQLATLAGALFVGLVAIALVFLLGMRAKSPLVLRPPHPAPARDHQPEADAIGGHARSVRVRDPASRPDLGPTVRDARRGGGRRRRVPDRARVRVTHELAPERAGERVRHHRARGADLRGRPAGDSSRCRRWRPGSRPATSRASVCSPSTRRSGSGGSSRKWAGAQFTDAPQAKAPRIPPPTRPGRWRPSMSHEPRTVVRDFRPEDRDAALQVLAASFQGFGPAGPGGRR